MFLCLVKRVAIVKKVNEFQVAIGAPGANVASKFSIKTSDPAAAAVALSVKGL